MKKGIRMATLLCTVMMTASISACDIKTGASFDLNEDGASYTIRHATAINGRITMQETYKGLPVTVIGERAFEGRAIDTFIFADTVVTVGNYAFLYSDVRTVDFSNSLQTIGENAFAFCYNLEEIVLPDSLTELGGRAFAHCWGLRRLEIGDSLKTIGKSAFQLNTSLESVQFGSALQNIDANAFDTCDKLKVVEFSLDAPLENIAERAFFQCGQIENLCLPSATLLIGEAAFHSCVSLKTVSLGNQMTQIGDYAFYNCEKLEEIVLPVSLTEIGECAFYKTPLRAVYYGGSPEDWAKISFGADAFSNEGETVYFYSETQPVKEGDWWHYDGDGNVTIW